MKSAITRAVKVRKSLQSSCSLCIHVQLVFGVRHVYVMYFAGFTGQVSS